MRSRLETSGWPAPKRVRYDTEREHSGGLAADDGARAAIVAAYERALAAVGSQPRATPLWVDYCAYIKAWSEGTLALGAARSAALRGALGRAVRLPLAEADGLWHEYEVLELEPK